MEIQVHDINPDLAHLHDPHDRVHVCPVAIDKAPFSVDDFANLPDILLKETEGIGVGYQDSSHILIHHLCYGLWSKDAVLIGFYRNRMKTTQ